MIRLNCRSSLLSVKKIYEELKVIKEPENELITLILSCGLFPLHWSLMDQLASDKLIDCVLEFSCQYATSVLNASITKYTVIISHNLVFTHARTPHAS